MCLSLFKLAFLIGEVRAPHWISTTPERYGCCSAVGCWSAYRTAEPFVVLPRYISLITSKRQNCLINCSWLITITNYFEVICFIYHILLVFTVVTLYSKGCGLGYRLITSRASKLYEMKLLKSDHLLLSYQPKVWILLHKFPGTHSCVLKHCISMRVKLL